MCLCSVGRLVRERRWVPLPTMYATIAYIDRNTAWDDVDFHVSRRYTSQQMAGYVRQVVAHVERSNVRLLAVTVFDGDMEVWSWRA